MPLFTDLPSFGYYYSGNVSPYSNHSSLGGSYSRSSPYSLSSFSGYPRGYSPLLSTINESRAGVVSRINSPKRLHLQSTTKYRAPKPIRINTADIDVSANKYRRERPIIAASPTESHIVYGVSSPTEPSIVPPQDGPFMPRAEPHEDDNTNRSTIKRGRTVVRLSTVRSRAPGPPINEGKVNWRRELEEELKYKNEKKVRKTPGEKLIEKHLIRDKSAENASSLDVEDVEDEEEEEEETPPACRSRAPSFHDICKDISSDKLYDDLNAGELRRIVDRRKSEDKPMISPIMEVPSEIVDVFNEDGTFHRRTTLKKIRKSTKDGKGIFIHVPDTPNIDQSAVFDINFNQENDQKSSKTPKITASVEVQNSGPSLRAVATEVQVETKHNEQKRKFFYKIVVEDVIETNTNEKSASSKENSDIVNKEDHNANTLHDISAHATKKTSLYSKAENISSKELDKIKTKEIREKKTSAKKLSNKLVSRPSKIKVADDNADNFWDVIGSRESVYYTARRKRILEEQRNRYAFEEIIPEVPDSPLINNLTECDKQMTNIEPDDINKTDCNISSEPTLPISKVAIKNKKNTTEQPVEVKIKPLEVKSKPTAPIASKVPLQKEKNDNTAPSVICNKEKSAKVSVMPKISSNENIAPVTSKVPVQKEPIDNTIHSAINNKEKSAKVTVIPQTSSNENIAPIISKMSVQKESIEITTSSATSNKEKSAKVSVMPKTPSNESLAKPLIIQNKTHDKDITNALKEVPSPTNKIVPLINSISNNSSQEICAKKEDLTKKPDAKNLKGEDVLVVSPKDSTPSVLSTTPGQENNIIKYDTDKEPKLSPDVTKSPQVSADKLTTVTKPRNKKYVKAKTLDLRQNEDISKDSASKTSAKDQAGKETKQTNELKKRSSETDITKKTDKKSATVLKIDNKVETTLKSKQANDSLMPTIDKAENALSKERQLISVNLTEIMKEPVIIEKVPNPPLQKAVLKLNEDKKESPADLKNKKPCKLLVKTIKPVDDVHKLPEKKPTVEIKDLTILQDKQINNSVKPVVKDKIQSKADNTSLKDKLTNKTITTETTNGAKPQTNIEEKQKALTGKGEVVQPNVETKEKSSDIKSKKPHKPSVKSIKSGNEIKSPSEIDPKPYSSAENKDINKIESPKSCMTSVEIITSDMKKCVESNNAPDQLGMLSESSKSKSEEQSVELSTSSSDTSVSKKSLSSHNSGRQSLKSFSERVTERVRNPSLRLVTRAPDEPKLKPSLISMNTSSDLTAIIKEPITPVQKKIKVIPKNEPAQKPLIATPRPLQAVIRNRKAQQLHQSIDSDSDSSDSSWTDSSEEESDESEFFECGSPIDNPIASMENLITTEPSYVYAQFLKTSKIVPPATKIPRFRKYAVEDFNFLKVLGKGSFGKVLLAELKNTEFYYAVKCLNKNIVLEDDDVECTLIERKVLALGTKHPYLCHLFCTFQTESHLFFVMEYLNGGDLMFHIQHSGRFPEPRASFYAAEIVSGLRFLHKKGIVYRDLKLDNILLDFDGHVRIADFGMCKLQIYLDKTADTFCGTPDYMAPEIIKGLNYNQSVDWWSFGVLLYEMLIGQSPFSGCDEDELFWSICNEIPYYPRHLSPEALEILTRFLNKDSEVRLGSGTCPYGDVMDQRFFQDIDWGRLERRQLVPPFKPRVLHPLDTQYFDKAFTGEAARLTPIDEAVIRGMDHDRFHGFSYTNPNATD